MPNKAFIDFNLPFDEAIAYFESKTLKPTWRWDELSESAHARAFTVAKGARIDVLSVLKDALVQSMQNGETFEDFQKSITPRLQKLGWIGKPILGTPTDSGISAEQVELGTPRRLKTIYQANIQSAYMAGKYVQAMENVKYRPYWQYWALMDGKTRPAHRALHGKVFRYDDPFWNILYPPNGYKCRCTIRELSQRDMDRLGLKVTDTTGAFGSREVLVSKSTGEVRQVPTYTFKDASGKTITVSPDVGWSSNVGKDYLESLQTLQYEKAQKFGNKGIFADTLDSFRESGYKKEFIKFVASIQLDKTFNQNGTVAGYLDMLVYSFLDKKGIVVETPHIWLMKSEYEHFFRPTKPDAKKPLKSEVFDIPNVLDGGASRILWDTVEKNVIYLYDGIDKKNKFIVRVNYNIKQRGVDGEKIGVANSIRNFEPVNDKNIEAGIKGGIYEIIK